MSINYNFTYNKKNNNKKIEKFCKRKQPQSKSSMFSFVFYREIEKQNNK